MELSVLAARIDTLRQALDQFMIQISPGEIRRHLGWIHTNDARSQTSIDHLKD